MGGGWLIINEPGVGDSGTVRDVDCPGRDGRLLQEEPPHHCAVRAVSNDVGGESTPRGTGSEPKATVMSLASDLTAWLALRRVDRGGVTFLNGAFYQEGRPVPEYLNRTFADLVEEKRLSLDEVHPTGMRQVMFAEEGRELYAQLCGQRNGSCVVSVGRWPVSAVPEEGR